MRRAVVLQHVVCGVRSSGEALKVFKAVVVLDAVNVVNVVSVWDGSVCPLPHVPVHVDAAVLFVVSFVVPRGLAVKPDSVDFVDGVFGSWHVDSPDVNSTSV